MDDQGLTLQLREREKELACLYRLARVLTAFHPEEETARIVARAVRDALSAPDSARVHVRLGTVDAFSPAMEHSDHPPEEEDNNRSHRAAIVTTAGRIGELIAWYPAVASTASRASVPVPAVHDHEREMMNAVADLLSDNAERRRVVEELSATVEAESRKTVALEEVLSRVEELRRRSQAELRTALDADVLPLVARLEEVCHDSHDNPARMLLESLRRALTALGSDQATHAPAIRARLSPREYEIAQLIASGMPSKQIAQMLNLAYGTVERHRHSIRRKLGIRHEAINLATYLRTKADDQQ